MTESSTADAYTVRALDASTWDAFAELVERNNGVFGGCWCMGHHASDDGERFKFQKIDRRATKQELVRTDRAHAALVFDADGLVQGWAKYGRLAEQPIIEHNRRAYEAEPPQQPDWRITCYYTDTSIADRASVAPGRATARRGSATRTGPAATLRRTDRVPAHRWSRDRMALYAG